jgi:hypothetical protein
VFKKTTLSFAYGLILIKTGIIKVHKEVFYDKRYNNDFTTVKRTNAKRELGVQEVLFVCFCMHGRHAQGKTRQLRQGTQKEI